MDKLKQLNKKLIFIFFLFSLTLSCQLFNQSSSPTPKSDGKKTYEEFRATIKSFPYEASLSRKEQIIQNHKYLQKGMTKEQVCKLIGEPDYSELSYGPARLNAKWQGSYWYYFLFKKENSGNNKDNFILIFFGIDDQVKHIDSVNIEGLSERDNVPNSKQFSSYKPLPVNKILNSL